MEACNDDCLLSDIEVAQELGIPLDTRATEISSRPTLPGIRTTRQCLGCQATCRLLEPAGEKPRYIGGAQEQLRADCPDYPPEDTV